MKQKFFSNKGFTSVVLSIIVIVFVISLVGIYFYFSKTNQSNKGNEVSQPSTTQNNEGEEIDLSKAKGADKLNDGYLFIINDIKPQSEMDTYVDSISYLVLIPSLDKKLTNKDIQVIASYKNANSFGYAIVDNNVYFIETFNAGPKPENDFSFYPPFLEQSIYKVSLTDMSKKQLVNIKMDNYYRPDSYTRELLFHENKMYYMSKQDLYEYDLEYNVNRFLIDLPPSTNVYIDDTKPYTVNSFTNTNVEQNELLMYHDTCPFFKGPQGGCPQGRYSLIYNIVTGEVVNGVSDEIYDSRCRLVKVSAGKINEVVFSDCEDPEYKKGIDLLNNQTYSLEVPKVLSK